MAARILALSEPAVAEKLAEFKRNDYKI